MCMRNINTNIIFADITTNQEGTIYSLENIGKKFHILSEDNDKKIVSMSMALLISASEEKNNNSVFDESIFSFENNYELRVRLTETYSGDFKDLAKIELEPQKTAVSSGLCKTTFNHTQLCFFERIELPSRLGSKEKYVIKVVVRAKDENNTDRKWFVQSVHPIEFFTVANSEQLNS